MKTEIIRIKLGVINCYLVRQQGLIMVDAGSKADARGFGPAPRKHSVLPGNIGLLFVTHGHWDHFAGACEIKRQTGAKTAINHRDRELMEKGVNQLPPALGGWGTIFRFFLKTAGPFIKLPPTSVDVELSDQGLRLDPWGVEGEIIHTPGHSAGSMSLVLNSGEALVGDLAMNGPPMRLGAGLPPLGDNENLIKESWRLILERGAKTIYPAHGRPFPAKILRTILDH